MWDRILLLNEKMRVITVKTVSANFTWTEPGKINISCLVFFWFELKSKMLCRVPLYTIQIERNTKGRNWKSGITVYICFITLKIVVAINQFLMKLNQCKPIFSNTRISKILFGGDADKLLGGDYISLHPRICTTANKNKQLNIACKSIRKNLILYNNTQLNSIVYILPKTFTIHCVERFHITVVFYNIFHRSL